MLRSTSGSKKRGLASAKESNDVWNQLALATTSGTACQPALLSGGTLHAHQLQGLSWLLSLHNLDLNGILADEMGLGKTVQVIALIAHLIEAGKAAKPFLILVPASLVANWEAEFAAWAPSIQVVAYRGSAAEREEIFATQVRGRQGSSRRMQVLLTTYETFMHKLDCPRLSQLRWEYLIVDEGHRLKNAGCKLVREMKRYSVAHRLLLTGTPLQNNLDELWSLLNVLMPSLFNCMDDFHTWFSGPSGAAAESDHMQLDEEETLLVTHRLHQVLRPFILRRLKQAVASELPAKVERLVPCAASPYQKALIDMVMRSARGDSSGGDASTKTRHINNAVMELRNICNHPLLSRLHQPGSEAGLRTGSALPAMLQLCGKLDTLDRLLRKLVFGGHKVLIFSTMTRALDIVEEYLDWAGLDSMRLDGSTAAAERGPLVQAFNAPDSTIPIFLLSVRAGGMGLNLQAADTVIMYDTDWNPQIDLQAQARVHRLGQTKQVLILRLQTINSIESHVLAVADGKRVFADKSIDGGFFDGHTSAETRKQYLLNLLRESAADKLGSPSAREHLSDADIDALLDRRSRLQIS
ncbi:hypothetical protein WJX73_003156 [Symbiochloris irregularis]|uniref:Uncharacterized protein n=1 Tax=Symbiochloris irregularis TaxID=706552 RepID=A0AAW1NUS1_9CHLO